MSKNNTPSTDSDYATLNWDSLSSMEESIYDKPIPLGPKPGRFDNLSYISYATPSIMPMPTEPSETIKFTLPESVRNALGALGSPGNIASQRHSEHMHTDTPVFVENRTIEKALFDRFKSIPGIEAYRVNRTPENFSPPLPRQFSSVSDSLATENENFAFDLLFHLYDAFPDQEVSNAEKRRALRSWGFVVGSRGRLSAAHLAEYEKRTS